LPTLKFKPNRHIDYAETVLPMRGFLGGSREQNY
jgi:hypothetical protein